MHALQKGTPGTARKQAAHAPREDRFGGGVREARRDVFGEPALKKTEEGYDLSESARRQLEAIGDPAALDEAAPILEQVYALLPSLLREATTHFEGGHRRDVFLTGALPLLAGCMPNYRGYYGQPSETLAPNFYVTVIAGAAGGKSVLRWGMRLVAKVDEHLRKTSEVERQLWKERREHAQELEEPPPPGEKPPLRSLILPPDMSAAGFHRALKDRGGRVCIFGTEIDTLVNALAQEWGRFDADLRKAYHHEPISSIRAGGEERAVRDPQVSLVLSGTQGQFQRLIRSTENGLYSRLAVYYFDVHEPWRSQRPASDPGQRKEHFAALSEKVRGFCLELASREEPLWFLMEKRHWDRHDETFAWLLRRVYAEGRGHLSDVVKRAGVIAFRIAMTLCLIRRHEEGAQLASTKTITASDEDVEAALTLACCYADHALRFSQTLEHQPSKDTSTYRIGQLLHYLGDEFRNAEVYRQAGGLDLKVSERTLRRDLEKAADVGLIEQTKRSHWKKTCAGAGRCPECPECPEATSGTQ